MLTKLLEGLKALVRDLPISCFGLVAARENLEFKMLLLPMRENKPSGATTEISVAPQPRGQ